MKKTNFLGKLRKTGKLGIVEPSNEIKESYLIKSDNCLRSAKILSQNALYENAVTEAYYAMYNCLLALLYLAGIKSENHFASISLLEKIFKAEDLSKLILFAKEERIDKQYYVESEQKYKATKESCDDALIKAEDFMIGIKVLINKLNNSDITGIRIAFENLFKEKKVV